MKCTPNYRLYKMWKPKVWEWIMSFNGKDTVTRQVLEPVNSCSLKNLMNEVSWTQFCWSLPERMKTLLTFLFVFWVQQSKMLSVSIHLHERQKICRAVNRSTNIFVNFFRQIIYLWNNLWRKFLPHALDILHMLLIDTICISSKALRAFFNSSRNISKQPTNTWGHNCLTVVFNI